ncbi:hypothetical protein AB0C96_25100 [Streptomyces sp. NPDC048506]|uniref:hypothetical protein n=1 Tax=Streptomyces sp. NPDC048506 TaxID=3155028 RepID=UPI003448ECBE
MRDDFRPRSDNPGEYAARSAAAWAWLSSAVDAQQEGEWVLDAMERQVLADVVASTNALHGGHLPPHTQDPVHTRVGRISNWAGVLRLAARAGGWELLPVVGRDPSAGTRPVGMAHLLSGVYALAEQGERWQECMRDVARMRHTAVRESGVPSEQSFEEALVEQCPGFERDLADAEAFFTGPGSLEDLMLFFY